jgi:hypothetical protein
MGTSKHRRLCLLRSSHKDQALLVLVARSSVRMLLASSPFQKSTLVGRRAAEPGAGEGRSADNAGGAPLSSTLEGIGFDPSQNFHHGRFGGSFDAKCLASGPHFTVPVKITETPALRRSLANIGVGFPVTMLTPFSGLVQNPMRVKCWQSSQIFIACPLAMR